MPSDGKISLFQYWDKKAPPLEVSELLQSWENESSFAYRRFDREEADAMIAAHLDSDAVNAFRDCRNPAMQADFFRICALYAYGRLYADADISSLGGIHELLEDIDRGFLMLRRHMITNDLIFMRAAGEMVMEYAINKAIDNIRRRVSNNVLRVTGPAILSQPFKGKVERPAGLFDGLTIVGMPCFKQYVRFHWKLQYKKRDDYWFKMVDGSRGSIFEDRTGTAI